MSNISKGYEIRTGFGPEEVSIRGGRLYSHREIIPGPVTDVEHWEPKDLMFWEGVKDLSGPDDRYTQIRQEFLSRIHDQIASLEPAQGVINE